MILKLDPLDYQKPLMSNEMVMRGKDQISLIMAKVNELIEGYNELEKKIIGEGKKI